MVINLRQNKNDDSTAYGKYYAEVDSKEPLNLKGFAKHMTGHGKIADYQMCVLVLGQVVDCMTELLAQGQPVKLDGLGTFYPTIEGTGADSVLEYLPAVNIKGVHLRFLPEGTKDEDITSRALKDACVFEMHDVVETKTKMIGGKEKTYQERTPISTYAIAHADPDPEP